MGIENGDKTQDKIQRFLGDDNRLNPEFVRYHRHQMMDSLRSIRKKPNAFVAMITRCFHFSSMWVDFERCGVDADYRRKHVLDYIQCIHVELAELIEKFDWKHWHSKGGDDLEAAVEEYADILHFVFNLGLAMGMDATDMIQMFVVKNETNWQRQIEGRDRSTDHELT